MNIEVITVEIAKLSLKPGDTLVLKVSGNPSEDLQNHMLRGLEKVLPKGCFCILTPETCEFQVIEGGTKA